MSRSSGTYTAPSNSVNPAVEGTVIDETDFNTFVDDLETALTESVYTGGLGSTDNRLVRTDGTDTKKVQGTGITVDDSDNVTGVAALTATTVNIGNADTTLARTGAGDISVEGNAIYRAGGTDVPIADGGTGASTAAAGARALLEGIGSTQGDILYRSGTEWTALGTGTLGQVLTAGGAGANPAWGSVAGTGDVVGPASSTDNTLPRYDSTTGKLLQGSGVVVDDSNNVSGMATLTLPNTGLHILDSDASHDLIIVPGSNLSADRNLTLTTGDAARTVTLSGDLTVGGTSSINGTAYVSGGTDVAIADGGTGASTATAAFNALSPMTTQGDIAYHNGTNVVRLAAGTSGQFLKTLGAGANPAWDSPAGSGTVTSIGPEAGLYSLISGTYSTSAAVTGAGTMGIRIPLTAGGRLSLSSATPVLSSTVSGATTVYYTADQHQFVPIFNGTVVVMTQFGELSQATTDTTKSPAAATTTSNYDMFVWNDSGTIRCTRGPAWSSSTSRGTGAGTTELTTVNASGLLMNANNITNGPAASRGTYVGTIRTNGSSQVDWIYGASGTAAFFGVWNMYNRVLVGTYLNEGTTTWTYSSATIRALNATSINRVSFVRGLNDENVSVFAQTFIDTVGTGTSAQFGFGLDSTTAFTTSIQATGPAQAGIGSCAYQGLPGLGFHYLQMLEKNTNGSTGYAAYGTSGLSSFSAQLRA